MVQTDFVWELVEAFARRRATPESSEKSMLLVFLQPQALAGCWPDVCTGHLLPCHDCSGQESHDAPGIDGAAVCDTYHIPVPNQPLTVELFFLREHYADAVTSIRVTYSGCEKEEQPTNNFSSIPTVNRNRLFLDQRVADIYGEVLKFLCRRELDTCELIGRQWRQLIRSISSGLPLHCIRTAGVEADSLSMKCDLVQRQRRRETRIFDLTSGEPSALNGLRNSHIVSLRISETSGVVISMLSAWLEDKANRTFAKNLLLRLPLPGLHAIRGTSLKDILDALQPVTLQLALDRAHRDFRLLNDALLVGQNAVPRLLVIQGALRETRSFLDFLLHRRTCPVLLVSAESVGQDADWLVMDLIECLQQQSNLGTFQWPLYLEYTANEPVLLDLDGATLEKDFEQHSLAFPALHTNTGIYSTYEERQFVVYKSGTRGEEVALLYVSRKPSFPQNDGDTFRRYLAFKAK